MAKMKMVRVILEVRPDDMTHVDAHKDTIYLFRDFELPSFPRIGDEIRHGRKHDNVIIERVEWLADSDFGFVASAGYGFDAPSVEFYARPTKWSVVCYRPDGPKPTRDDVLSSMIQWRERKMR